MPRLGDLWKASMRPPIRNPGQTIGALSSDVFRRPRRRKIGGRRSWPQGYHASIPDVDRIRFPSRAVRASPTSRAPITLWGLGRAAHDMKLVEPLARSCQGRGEGTRRELGLAQPDWVKTAIRSPRPGHRIPGNYHQGRRLDLLRPGRRLYLDEIARPGCTERGLQEFGWMVAVTHGGGDGDGGTYDHKGVLRYDGRPLRRVACTAGIISVRAPLPGGRVGQIVSSTRCGGSTGSPRHNIKAGPRHVRVGGLRGVWVGSGFVFRGAQ